MGHAAASAIERAGLELIPFTVCGDDQAADLPEVQVGAVTCRTVPASQKQTLFDDLKARHGKDLMVIDYTLPTAVNENASFYVANEVPFVMGTTGGDRERMLQEVEASGLYAVIAPQMGKQVVAFQAMMDFVATSFPDSFQGYKLEVRESHQSTKADTSGTAKDVVASMTKLGVQPFDVEDIQLVRGEEASMKEMGVPESALSGHAFHTYRLTSPDDTVRMEFQHNVCGREIYAEGSVDAALFLHKMIAQGSDRRVFNMIDVLKAGAMR